MVDKKNNMDPRFLNAAATYNEVMASGLPAAPLEFPSPVFATTNRVNASVYNPDVDEEIVVPNVIYEVRRDGQPPKRAYWIGRKLKNAIYGCVCSCSVLKVREGGWAGPDGNSIWEITPEFAAVKILDLDVIRKRQEQKDKISEDPIKEVAAMQYSSSEGSKPHVLPCWDVFLDEQYIYMVMPLCSKGELFEYVKWNGRFDESVARYWFKQLLSVSPSISSFLIHFALGVMSLHVSGLFDKRH
jgi:serine/threonine protein kinase